MSEGPHQPCMTFPWHQTNDAFTLTGALRAAMQKGSSQKKTNQQQHRVIEEGSQFWPTFVTTQCHSWHCISYFYYLLHKVTATEVTFYQRCSVLVSDNVSNSWIWTWSPIPQVTPVCLVLFSHTVCFCLNTKGPKILWIWCVHGQLSTVNTSLWSPLGLTK